MKPSGIIVGLICLSLLTEVGTAQQAAAPTTYQIHVAGRSQPLELVNDAIAIRGAQGRRVIKPVSSGNAKTEAAKERRKSQPGTEVELILRAQSLGPKARSGPASLHFVTPRLLVRLTDGADRNAVAAKAGLRLVAGPALRADLLLFDAANSEAALAAMQFLRTLPEVRSADVQLATKRQPKLIPNDPLFAQQWHLHNTTQLDGALWVDANLTGVWDRFTGEGILIGVIDDGLQHSHPDLAPNYNSALDYDFNGDDEDPTPVNLADDSHGTSCAGVAAARGNNGIGVSGAAPRATLTGFRLIAEANTDQQEADALLIHNDQIHIKSNSWGFADGDGYGGGGPLALAALEEGTRSGRAGKGTIFVFAGGNGLDVADNSNMDGYASSPHVIAVGAVNDFGFQSYYSEPGANLLISAPSNGGGHNAGIRTTDLTGASGRNATGDNDLSDRNYTSKFGGTSSACPLVSGVVALMLQANPNLGWRDVQEILIRSARRNHRADPDWASNAAGLSFNHKYGAGLIDAAAAVSLAEQWINLPAMTEVSVVQSGLNRAIPDNDSNGITQSLEVTEPNLRVEHVTVHVSATHSAVGDLEILLTSPSGMVSRLVHSYPDTADGLDWTFSSVRHWGESAAGTWSVKIADRSNQDTGTLSAVTLKILGSTHNGPRLAGSGITLISESNLPPNQSADPGEDITVDLELRNIGATASTANLTATLLPIGGISQVSAPQIYSSLSPGGAGSIARFSLRINGANGMSLPAILRLRDGATDLGLASVNIPLGTLTSSSSTSPSTIAINDNSPANPSPSSISVSGLGGRLQRLTVDFNTVTHSAIDDVGALLLGPDALMVRLFCGGHKGPVNSLNFTFDDSAETYFTALGVPVSGSYRCWDYYGPYNPATGKGRDFAAEPLSAEQGYTLGEFLGLRPNGDWKLYIEDFAPLDSGSIGSWKLNFTTANCVDNILLTQDSTEVHEDAGTIAVSVTRTGGLEGTASIAYSTIDEMANAGSDYVSSAGVLNFAPGELTKTFPIEIINDNLREGPEAIRVRLSSVSGNSGLGRRPEGTVVIVKNDVSVQSLALTGSQGSLDGKLSAGDSIEATISFSDPVTMSGTPVLDLNIGGLTRQASYSTGSGSSTLRFTYTISLTDLDEDGISIQANALRLASGSTILDESGKPARLGHAAVAANLDYIVENPSSVVEIAITSSQGGLQTWHNSGDRLTARVTFNTAVTVGGKPQLALDIGGVTRQAGYLGGSGTTVLEFAYSILATDNDSDGVAIKANALSGGTLLDSTGSALIRGNAAVASNPNYRVDNVLAKPRSVAVAGSDSPQGEWHHEGHRLTARILFDEPVFISGGPQLMLDVGGAARTAVYLGGAGNTTLEFVYTVVAADNDLDGVAVRANALVGGTVTDQAGNPVLRTQAASAGNPAFKVIGVDPINRNPSVDSSSLLSGLHRVGQSLLLPLAAGSADLPTAQLGLQWFFNGRPLPGAPSDARQADLYVPALKLSDAGVYQARFTRDVLLPKAQGVTSSNPVSIAVVEDFSPPRLLWVRAQSRVSLLCNAAGVGLRYSWQRRDGQALPAGSSGSSTKMLSLPAASAALEGIYECVVSNFSGSITAASTQLRVHAADQSPTALPELNLPSGRVGSPYQHSLRDELSADAKVSSFTASGLPAGLKLDSTTGLISGVPTTATQASIRLTTKLGSLSSAVQSRSLLISAATSGFEGTYHGWVDRDPNLNQDLGSRLEMTIGRNGLFSGKLSTGLTSTPFVGTLQSGADLDPPSDAIIGMATLARATPLPACLLRFEIEPGSSKLSAGARLSSINTLEGTAQGEQGSAMVSAWRGMTDVGELADRSGRYHMALKLPQSAVGDGSLPQGHGFAVIGISANGSVRLEGSSGDGQNILGSTILGPEGQILLYQGLYASPIKGSLLGEIRLVTGATAAEHRLQGQVSWIKSGHRALEPISTNAATRTYRNGFGLPSASQGLLLEVIGGMYAPTSTQIPSGLLLPLGQPAPVSGTMFNATLRFSGGGIDRDIEGTRQARFSPDALVSVDSLSRVTLAALPPATLPFAKTTLSAVRSTGLIRGEFTLQDPDRTTTSSLSESELTRKVRFSGLIVPFSPTEHIGYGFFMLPQVPMSSSDTPYKLAPVESGALLFDLIDG